jgi:hypothetical protein
MTGADALSEVERAASRSEACLTVVGRAWFVAFGGGIGGQFLGDG